MLLAAGVKLLSAASIARKFVVQSFFRHGTLNFWRNASKAASYRRWAALSETPTSWPIS